jgi:2-polyprenyl-3-methyl-5-hydroxy-6-metoxy-1,4-benzoquinol methylase
MQQYWREHAQQRVDVDFERDPEGLSNVCYVGAPLWLNEHHARQQVRVFDHLLSQIDPPSSPRALDVGCGTGRWSRRLDAAGFGVTGIDLQPELIERNASSESAIDFYCSSLQDFETDDRYDLITSITVIQHVPFEEQINLVARIGELLRPGGRVIILENIRDQTPHVFARTTSSWVQLFEDHGIQIVASHKYDYNPAITLLSNIQKRLSQLKPDGADADPTSVSDYNQAKTSPQGSRSVKSILRRGAAVARRIAGFIDAWLEPRLIERQSSMTAGHCGFLFVKPE